MIKANNPNLKSWLTVKEGSDFPIQNIPFGIAIIEDSKLAVSRIGDTVINLSKLYDLSAFNEILSQNYFDKDCLNDFLKLKKTDWRSVRNTMSQIFTDYHNQEKSKSNLYNIKDICSFPI